MAMKYLFYSQDIAFTSIFFPELFKGAETFLFIVELVYIRILALTFTSYIAFLVPRYGVL
jgi:hypothetical protein